MNLTKCFFLGVFFFVIQNGVSEHFLNKKVVDTTLEVVSTDPIFSHLKWGANPGSHSLNLKNDLASHFFTQKEVLNLVFLAGPTRRE